MASPKLPDCPAPSRPGRIVLVHGAGHDGSTWDRQANALRSETCRVIAPDLPGHGLASPPALQDIASMAAWLIERLRADNWGATAIAGHSMGSLVALEACAQAPELFHSLVLVGTSYPMPVAPVLLQAATSEPDRAHALINKWSFAPSIGEPDPADTLRAANLAMMQRQAPGVLASDLAACDAYRGALEAATHIACRCALVCGVHDRMTPPGSADSLRAVLAGGGREVSVISIERAGHSMMSEQPEALTRALRAFCSPPD